MSLLYKAHLDGVGRGEWGEAHILAHQAGYTCVHDLDTYSRTSRCRMICRVMYLDV
jgi:hypothetical protein